MRLLHAAAKTRVCFDDPNLTSHAGLVPAMRLAQNVGLEELVDEQVQVQVQVQASVGANAGVKVGSLLRQRHGSGPPAVHVRRDRQLAGAHRRQTAVLAPGPSAGAGQFTAGLYIAEGGKVRPECVDFAASLQNSTGSWVQTVARNGAGSTPGLLGYMFWVPIPMPALRQS
jgi:hypothetical protein